MKKKILSLLLAFMMLVPASSVLARDNSNHNWSDWYVDTYPDCGNSRQKSRLCYDYNEVQHRSIPVIKKHEWTSWEITKTVTVFRTGVKERECWRCDAVQTATIPKLKPFVKLNKKKLTLSRSRTIYHGSISSCPEGRGCKVCF